MAEIYCTECTWSGDYADSVSPFRDSDSQELAEILGACPECYASTVDAESIDLDDLSDSRGD